MSCETAKPGLARSYAKQNLNDGRYGALGCKTGRAITELLSKRF
jgi:hypothetical protein